MSDDNRSPYTPQSDAPLAFDARRARGPDERGRPGILIISAVVLLLLVVAFAVFFMTRMNSSGEGEPQVFDAMKVEADGAGTPAADAAASDGMVVEPVETLQPEIDTTGEAPLEVARPENETGVAATPKAAEPKAAPVVRAEPARPSPAPAAASGVTVQIGAYSSAALAEREWNAIAIGIPAQMAGKTRLVEPVQVDGQTRYRALIGGFDSRADADAFCQRLRSAGRECFARG